MDNKNREDDLASTRSIFGWGFIMFIFWSFLFFLLTSCSVICPKPQPQPKPEVETVIKYVYVAGELTDKAKAELDKAKATAEEMRLEAQEANKLVKDMQDASSPYAGNVYSLVSSYQDKISALQQQIKDTDEVLQELGITLSITKAELDHTKKAIDASENEKLLLRAEVVRIQKQSDKYKAKYEALKKYRYAIIAMSIWLVIKIIGSVGAWTPQGRIAKALIG